MEVDALVRRLLAEVVVDDDAAPANFSLRLTDASDRGAQDLHILYRGRTLAARSRRPSRIVHALVAALGDVASSQSGEVLCLEMLALVSDSGAMLLPRPLRGRVLGLEARLNRQGLRVVDGEFVRVDRETAEVVVAPPAFGVDAALIEAFDDRFSCREGGGRAAADGRYPVEGIVTPGPLADESPLAVLAQLTPLVANGRHVGADDTLELVAGLVQRARCAGPALPDDAALLQLLSGLGGR